MMASYLSVGWVIGVLVVSGSFGSPVRAEPETFSKHAVVAQEGRAADAGRDILRGGGNAIDAAIATAFALAVTLPEAGNLGGGGFIVAFLADRHEVITVDFREAAPQSAGPRMYLGPDGKLRPHHRDGAGRRPFRAQSAASVWLMPALARPHGLIWYAPPRQLARQGFPISADLAGSLNRQLTRANRERPSLVKGGLWPPGTLPRVDRRVREARSHTVASRRPIGPARPGRHSRPDRGRGCR